MSTEELLLTKREEILALAERYGAYNVRVFGSVARGEAGPASDVDLLVDLRPEVGLEYIALWQDLQDLLGRKVDLVTEQGLPPYLRPRVLKEAVPL
jgi:predicted nucleotidyltransferase